MRINITCKDNLAAVLQQSGHRLDLRCGGQGTCGRCRVELLSGTWEVEKRVVQAPGSALACRTRLLSDSGEVEFTPAAGNGSISADWSSRPLPVNPATVFGVDIGTTTIAAVKVRQGEVVGRASCFNAQMDYGDNVLTRIGAAAGHLSALQAAVRSSVGGLLSELGSADAARIAVAGNTVMSCLFHGVDPASIGILPFTPPLRVFPPEIWDGLPLLTVPCIAGFVGGDITAGLWETALQEGEMLVDIGTNCEIVFHAPGGILCTAAAAGPAFEGAGLHFGCRAAPGAVEHYRGADDYSVIGGGEAEGLCGSAYIDFLAVERRRGHLNDFGRYEPKAEKMHLNHRVFIHEFDIAQLLKAKAAVRAGIKTIEEYCDCTARKIYLAGGFAQCLDLANAIAIGMLPDRDYSIVGNTSLGGAARLAAAPESMPELERIIDLPREIQLNTLPQFEDNFIDALLLP